MPGARQAKKRIEENAGAPVVTPSNYMGANAERKRRDPHGIMRDVATGCRVGSK